MQDIIAEHLDELIGSSWAFIIYAGFFYILSRFVDPPESKASSSSLKAVHNNKVFFHKDFKLESTYFFFNLFITDILGKLLTIFMTLYFLVPILPHQLFAEFIQSQNFAVQLLIGLLIADAAFFFPHWFAHRFLWPYHSIHHSAKELRWLTALRLHPVDHLSFVIGGTIALYIFGFEGEAIVQAIFIHGAYNLFVHANINLGFPRPLCYILGSPNYHRWHHASDKEAIDKNFATMFSLFDVIFCSYYYPRDKLPKTYGLYDHSKNYPKNFTGQILYPFQRIKKK